MKSKILIMASVLMCALLLVMMLPTAVVAAWPGDPTVNVPICTADNNQDQPRVCSDGTGGAVIVWQDKRSGTYDIYAQRINPDGVAQWSSGVVVCDAANDQTSTSLYFDGASSSFIIIWQDKRTDTGDIYAQKLDINGAPQWGDDGLAVCNLSGEQISPRFCPAPAISGGIITWQDKRNGNYDIFSQKINSSGTLLWTANGIPVCTDSTDQTTPRATPDSTGGAYIIWQDNRTANSIYGQRLDASGNIQWTADGKSLITTVNNPASPPNVFSAGDYAGGLVLFWQDNRSSPNYDIYAQKYNSTGDTQWTPATGVPVANAANEQGNFSVFTTSGTPATATITYKDNQYVGGSNFDIFAQRIDLTTGVKLWAADGVEVAVGASPQENPRSVSDNAGGLIACWDDSRSGTKDIYARKINSDCVAQWTSGGVPVCTAANNQSISGGPTSVSDNSGGAILAWTDFRGGTYSDIYAQRVFSDGTLGTGGGEGSISGHVYESNGQTAIAGATVTVFQGPLNQCGSAVTDQDGFYQITGLASGEYKVQANAPNHASQWYENSLAANGAKPVSVAGDTDTQDIDFKLGPGATISGHVLAGTTGIENALIIVSVPGAQGGLGLTYSGADGSYTTFGLPEGDYVVWALADGYASKWYNNASNPANASVLHVPVPGDKQNIDFSLEPGVPVSGHVYKESGGALEGATIAVFGPGGYPYALGWSEADGSYTTTGLLEGEYYVMAQSRGYITEWYDGVYNSNGATSVQVTAPGRQGIDFNLDEGGTISGYVRQSDGQTAIAGATVNVFDYDSLSSSWIGYASVTTDNEGHYVTSTLPAGQYGVRAQASGYAYEWYDNTYFTDQATPVTVTVSADRSGTDFTLELACSISGTVLDQSTGNPVDDLSAGSKDLTTGWHKFVYRSEEGEGASISRAAFKSPGDADWRWFSTSELNIRTAPEGGGQSGITLTTKKNTWTSHPLSMTAMLQCVEQDSTQEAGWYGQSVVDAVNQEENIHGNDDNFTSYYQAYFYVDNPGTWRFSTDSDDASDILIDDVWTARWYDGHGVANRWEHKARVTIWEYDSGTWINEYNTNADGTYTINNLPAGSYRLMAKAQGYVNEYFQEKYYQNEATAVVLSTGENETDINFTLERSGVIIGSVKNAGGTDGLANLSVECRRTIDDSKSWHTATTDSNGNFTIGGLPYGDYMVRSPGGGRWGANDDDYVMEYYNEKTGEGSATLVTVAGPPFPSGIILTLETGNSISGNVIADGGGNIANVHVFAEDYNTSEWKSGVNTDTDGNYTLHGIPAGTYRVRAVPSNNGLPYADEWYDNTYSKESAAAVEVLTSQTGINFSLAAGGSISGIVKNADGSQTLAGMHVHADLTDGSGGWGTCTGSDGAYTLGGLPYGQYHVYADSHSGCSGPVNYLREYWEECTGPPSPTPIVTVGAVPQTGINFTLEEGGTISGRVTAEVGGQGIANCHVYAEDYSTGMWKAGVNTNSGGYYTLNALPTSTYRVRATPSNTGLPYAGKYFNNTYDYNAATAVPVNAGENKPDIDFSLPAGGTISGIVKNANGSQTLAGMHVHADLADYSAGWGACTGSDGTYTIGDLPHGQYRVYADSLSKCGGPMNYLREYWQEQASSGQATLLTVDADTSPTSIIFTLAEGGTISGTVKNAGGTSGLADISVECKRPADGNKASWFSTTTDNDGNYTISGLPNGDYIVRAPAGTKWGSGDDNYVTEYYSEKTSEGTADLVTVGEGVNPTGKDFTLVTGGSISGSVGRTNGVIAGLHLYAADSTTKVWASGANTDASGNYTIHGLPTGSYFVRACASCSSMYYVDEWYNNVATQGEATAIPVTEGVDTGDKNFVLDAGGSISGYVKRSSDDSAVPGASVYAFTWDSLGGSGQWFYRNWTTTDGLGFYRIYGLPAGNYGVRASASTYATEWYDNKYFPTQVGPFAYNANPVTVIASEDKPGINFKLESGGSISGYVKTGGTGIGGATVQIYNYNDNGSYGGVTTSGNGYYQFSGLASGQYTVRVTAGGYASEWYSNVSGEVYTKEEATAVVVAAPADTPNINFDLVSGGTISGRVTATASGNGIQTSVLVLDQQGHVIGSGRTNSNGDYTSIGIIPGQYKVKVQVTGYITEFYPNAYEGQPFQLVTITAGVNTSGINFSLETAGAVTEVSVHPQTQEVSPGDTFTVEIKVDPKVAIAGVQFDLTFDPNLVTVNVNGVAEGDLLSQGGTIGTFFLKGTTNNTTGKITGVAGAITEPGGTVSTIGTFAIITMTAMAVDDTGTSPLQLSNVKVGDENADPVPFIVSDGSVTVVPYDDWDVNCDGDVNVFDMILVGQNWGNTGDPHWIRADVKKDGSIDVFDMILIGQHWTG